MWYLPGLSPSSPIPLCMGGSRFNRYCLIYQYMIRLTVYFRYYEMWFTWLLYTLCDIIYRSYVAWFFKYRFCTCKIDILLIIEREVFIRWNKIESSFMILLWLMLLINILRMFLITICVRLSSLLFSSSSLLLLVILQLLPRMCMLRMNFVWKPLFCSITYILPIMHHTLHLLSGTTPSYLYERADWHLNSGILSNPTHSVYCEREKKWCTTIKSTAYIF